MSRSGRNTYDSFNEPLGSSGYRRSEDDSYNSYSAQHGPGSGLSGFYANNKKRIFICLAVSVAVIVLIAIIAAVASKKDSDDGPSPPGPDDDWTTIGNLPAYRVGTDPRVLLYLPDVKGRRQEAINHVTKFGANGFTTYLLDYFDGGQYNSSNPNHAPVVAAQRVREAVAVLRQQDHITSIQVTGYCYGGGVAVLLADGTGEIDSAVAAHTAFGAASPAEQTAFINNIAIPTFFIMPQDDKNFNTPAPDYLAATIANNQEVAYKVYTNATHGFAVVVDELNPLAVAMQQRAFDDTVDWLRVHSTTSPPPYPTPYTNTTIGDLPTYVFGAGTDVVLYLQDEHGVYNTSIERAGWYAAAGFTVYYLDYFDGGAQNSSNPNHSVAYASQRVLRALILLRQQHPNSTIHATGYSFGGGVGVNLLQSTDPLSSVDSGVFASASRVTPALVAGIKRPVSWVMPQVDSGFNPSAPQYLTYTLLNGVEAEYKSYPNTTDGFAVEVNSRSDLVAMQLRAYQDTERWFNTHRAKGSSWPITPVTVSSTGAASSGGGVGVSSSSTAGSSGGTSMAATSVSSSSSGHSSSTGDSSSSGSSSSSSGSHSWGM